MCRRKGRLQQPYSDHEKDGEWSHAHRVAHGEKIELKKVVSGLKKAGVQYIGPCHCSGDKAAEVLKGIYKKNYIKVGVGRVIQ